MTRDGRERHHPQDGERQGRSGVAPDALGAEAGAREPGRAEDAALAREISRNVSDRVKVVPNAAGGFDFSLRKDG